MITGKEQMENSILFKDLLQSASAMATIDTPPFFEAYNENTKEIDSVSENVFMDQLAEKFVKNKVLDENESGFDRNVSVARSSAFALKAINSIYMTERIKDKIDKIFALNENTNRFTSQGITTDEQKEALKAHLKEYVEEKLSPKPKTEEGKKLVSDLKNLYAEYEADYKDINKDLFLLESCSYLNSVADKMTRGIDADTALFDAKKESIDSRLVNYISDTLYDNIERSARSIKDEIEVTPENIQEFRAYYGNGVRVKPNEFLEHAKNNNFTNEDKVWASIVYQEICENASLSMAVDGSPVDSIQMSDFRLNGAPMFIKGFGGNAPNKVDFACDVVANALQGNSISVVNPDTQKPVVVEPKFCEITEHRSTWEKIVDFFKDLLGISEKSKVKEIEKNIEAKADERKAIRDKVSFKELVDSDAYKKFVAPPSKQDKTKELSKKDPTLGL